MGSAIQVAVVSTELQRTLGRIEAKQELMLQMIHDMQARTRALEIRMYTWNGAFGVIIAAWTFFSGPIASMLGLK